MSDQYYTLEEVIKKLGKSRSTVLREAKAGEIPSELEEDKTKGRRYPKQAIDVLAEIQQKKAGKKQPRLVFSYSTPSDMWAEIQIGTNLYGEDDIVPYKKILEWRDINDEMHKSLKDNGRVVAYSCLMPLEESIMLPLLEDKIRERHIPNDAIKQWTDPRLSVYVSSLTVKPTGDAQIDTERGFQLLRHTAKWALSLHRQFDIKNWYGIGATEQGQHLFEALGFTEIVSIHNGARKGYKLEEVRTPVRLVSQLLRQMEASSELTVNLTGIRAVDSDNRRKKTNTPNHQIGSVSASN